MVSTMHSPPHSYTAPVHLSSGSVPRAAAGTVPHRDAASAEYHAPRRSSEGNIGWSSDAEVGRPRDEEGGEGGEDEGAEGVADVDGAVPIVEQRVIDLSQPKLLDGMFDINLNERDARVHSEQTAVNPTAGNASNTVESKSPSMTITVPPLALPNRASGATPSQGFPHESSAEASRSPYGRGPGNSSHGRSPHVPHPPGRSSAGPNDNTQAFYPFPSQQAPVPYYVYAPPPFSPQPQHSPQQYGLFSAYSSESPGSPYGGHPSLQPPPPAPYTPETSAYYPSHPSSSAVPFPYYSPYGMPPPPLLRSPSHASVQSESHEGLVYASHDPASHLGGLAYGGDGSPAHSQDHLAYNYHPPTRQFTSAAPYQSPAYSQGHYGYSSPPVAAGYPAHLSGQADPMLHFASQGYGNQSFQRYQPVVFMPTTGGHRTHPTTFATPAPVPSPYSPPASEGLTRGHLAQAKLHGTVMDRGEGTTPEGGRRKARNSALPKPPAHSPHALWVGNVPSDSSHDELWHFFTMRPVPASNPVYAEKPELVPVGVDLQSTGVESIHLIARSNCAFVNYASDLHLQHAIQVSHGVCLRPFDPRCKDLVCRVRKRDDDTKSGVGAQRTGGLHHAYVQNKTREGQTDPVRQQRSSASSAHHSVSTASTSSSYLAHHFPKRYFVLKSHDEDDLKLSVDRGLWATQSHNEPVLDQAFRSCNDGVYLFFSANKSGEWFGYAKMASPISSSQDRRMSWTSRASADDSSGSGNSRGNLSISSSRPATIPEYGATVFEDSPRLFSPSEERFADRSPLPLSPAGMVDNIHRPRGDSAPAKLTAARAAQLSTSGDYIGDKLHLAKARKGGSLDPKMLAAEVVAVDQAVLDQEALGASSTVAEQDDDGVWRKDTLPTAEERNARLDKLEDATFEGKTSAQGWGKPFKVEWIKCSRLPFTQTRHILNGFNGNREIKISRDGTEIEPGAGEALIAEFWKAEGGVPPEIAPAAND